VKEHYLQDRLLTVLQKRGGYWRKKPQDAIAGDGDPDVYGCYRGHFVAFELKKNRDRTAAGQVRRIQLLTLREIANEGGVCAIVDTVLDALRILDAIDLQMVKAG
jgi:penicillin-binding protein-related factor A (putative recombinase)